MECLNCGTELDLKDDVEIEIATQDKNYLDILFICPECNEMYHTFIKIKDLVAV